MKILEKYILKKLLINCVITVSVVFMILYSISLLKIIDAFLNTNIKINDLIWLSLLNIITFFSHLFQFIVVTAFIVTLFNLTNNKELIMMQSLGFAPQTLIKPIILVSMLMLLMSFTLYFIVSPSANQISTKLTHQMLNSYNFNFLKERKFIKLNDNLTIYVKKVNYDQLTNVVIYQENPELSKKMIIYAKTGLIDKNYDNKFIILLSNVKITNVTQMSNIQHLKFDKYLIDLNKTITNATTQYKINDLNLKNLIEYALITYQYQKPTKNQLTTIMQFNPNTIINYILDRSIKSISTFIILVIIGYIFVKHKFSRSASVKPALLSFIIFICKHVIENVIDSNLRPETLNIGYIYVSLLIISSAFLIIYNFINRSRTIKRSQAHLSS